MTITSFRVLALVAIPLVLAACAGAPPAAVSETPDVARMLAEVQRAAEREQSAIEVMSLADPGVELLRQQSRAAAIAGRHDEAAARLDEALRLHPDSPQLVQDQAELELRWHDWAAAEALARRSWELGPRLGPLCARNWQTVIELRRVAKDADGEAAARAAQAECHVAAVPRY